MRHQTKKNRPPLPSYREIRWLFRDGLNVRIDNDGRTNRAVFVSEVM